MENKNKLRKIVYEALKIRENSRLHFCGISGIGMSGIAKILFELGFAVQGSSIEENYVVDGLRELGIPIFIGHDESNLKGVDILVKSSAIKKDNAEVLYATENAIPIYTRGDVLAAISNVQRSICVAGAHGKTTTTGMLFHTICSCGLNPTVINGGFINQYGTNAILSDLTDTQQNVDESLIIVESDESDRSFLALKSFISITTNIDPEHMENYKDFEDMKDCFAEFIMNSKACAVLNVGDRNLRDIMVKFRGNLVNQGTTLYTYQLLKNENDERDEDFTNFTFKNGSITHIVGKNAMTHHDHTKFDVEIYRNSNISPENQFSIQLGVLGKHNAENALSVICACIYMKLDIDGMLKGLKSFNGIKRRFTKIGKFNNTVIIDDYAHHPEEVKATIHTARHVVNYDNGGKLISILQPHKYTRLQYFMDDFARYISESDVMIVLDVYGATESPIPGVSSAILAERIEEISGKKAYYVDSKNVIEELKKILEKEANSEYDLILCMGAGDITLMAKQLVNKQL